MIRSFARRWIAANSKHKIQIASQTQSTETRQKKPADKNRRQKPVDKKGRFTIVKRLLRRAAVNSSAPGRYTSISSTSPNCRSSSSAKTEPDHPPLRRSGTFWALKPKLFLHSRQTDCINNSDPQYPCQMNSWTFLPWHRQIAQPTGL